MTVRELVGHLQNIVKDGGSERIVCMGDPRTQEYVEVTGLWIPRDEETVDLEAVEWEAFSPRRSAND